VAVDPGGNGVCCVRGGTGAGVFSGAKAESSGLVDAAGGHVAIALVVCGIGGAVVLPEPLCAFTRVVWGMGAVIGLMLWTYLTALAILIGAEANAELAKRRDSLFRGHLKAGERERSAAKVGRCGKRPACLGGMLDSRSGVLQAGPGSVKRSLLLGAGPLGFPKWPLGLRRVGYKTELC